MTNRLDMKKQILLVLMMMCATCVLGVTLPSNYYSSVTGSVPVSESFTTDAGITYMNASVVGAYDECIYDPKVYQNYPDLCTACCEPYFKQCIQEGNKDVSACLAVQGECVTTCQNNSKALGDSPLDAGAWLLLGMIVAYSIFTYYQKRQTA